MAKKNEKETKPQIPPYNYSVGYDLQQKLDHSADDHIADVYGLEGMLYDMWGDYRQAKQVLEELQLSGSQETDLGSFSVRLLAVKTHSGTRQHSGAAVFKFCMDYHTDGEHEARVMLTTITGKSTTDLIYQFTSDIAHQIQCWYDEKRQAKYGEEVETLPF